MATDPELWAKIRAGDAQAFDAFYRQHAARLTAFLRHVVGNRPAAEDVMQETFTEIWQRPNGFQPERGTLRGYLYGIGRKRAAEWWRKQHPEGAAPETDSGDAQAETRSVVENALQQLPEDQRSLLWLREVEGQSYAELSQILAVPIGTVRSRLFAAREALREVWRGSAVVTKERP